MNVWENLKLCRNTQPSVALFPHISRFSEFPLMLTYVNMANVFYFLNININKNWETQKIARLHNYKQTKCL